MKSCLIIVDSKDRITGNSASFTYSPLTLGLNNVLRFRVSKVSIPYSFYTTVDQSFNLTIGATTYTIQVLAGSYTAYQMATLLQNEITGTAGPGISVFYDQRYNLFNVYNSSSTPMQFNFNTGSVPTGYDLYNVGVQIGFVQATNVGEIYPPSDNIYGKYAVNMSSTTNIYIRSSALSIYYMSYFKGNRDSVIASVPINVDPNNWLIYYEFSPVFFDYGRNAINSIDFEFLDDSGNILDFRGLNPIIEIEVQFVE